MCTIGKQQGRRGFTLVELLVVIGIIGTLIAILLPATAAIRRSANKLKTQATFTAIAAGLEAYRNATGEPYPPSGGDAQGMMGAGGDSLPVDSPYEDGDHFIAITGANLLVWALAGADLLGSPGFKDLGGEDGWWDDTDNSCEDAPYGLYALDSCASSPTLDPLHRRFGPFLDIAKTDIVTMEEYAEDVLLPKNNPEASIPLPPSAGALSSDPDDYLRQRFILDGFGYPILYYRANVGASRITPFYTIDAPGVYDPVHNALYVGYIGPGWSLGGMDLGAGSQHRLVDPISPSPNPAEEDLSDFAYDGTFAKFIWDQKVTARNVPVKKDSYLLISPGPDALWGTDDDITNFNQ